MRRIRGMKVLSGVELMIHRYIEDTAFKASLISGFKEIRVPILEYSSVFERSLDELSDVVSKELYAFNDKKGRTLALRPEFTAPIMRSVISYEVEETLPMRLATVGPLFRYDRPQKGRQRQFHQFNVESVGHGGAFEDFSIISLSHAILSKVGVLSGGKSAIENYDVTLRLNSLGCTTTRKNYETELGSYFARYSNELSIPSQKKLMAAKPLRIFDSKDRKDLDVCSEAPSISSFYTPEAEVYFSEVRELLRRNNVTFTVDSKLVRGLDYYTHTIFEYEARPKENHKREAQFEGAILGGGRYDGLAEQLGSSKPIASIGFGAGIERIGLLVAERMKQDGAFLKKILDSREISVAVIPISKSASLDELTICANVAEKVRGLGICCEVVSAGSLKRKMKYAANKSNSFVVLLGKDEIESKVLKLKDLETSEELTMEEGELLIHLSLKQKQK